MWCGGTWTVGREQQRKEAENLGQVLFLEGYKVVQLVGVLRYKPEGRGTLSGSEPLNFSLA